MLELKDANGISLNIHQMRMMCACGINMNGATVGERARLSCVCVSAYFSWPGINAYTFTEQGPEGSSNLSKWDGIADIRCTTKDTTNFKWCYRNDQSHEMRLLISMKSLVKAITIAAATTQIISFTNVVNQILLLWLFSSRCCRAVDWHFFTILFSTYELTNDWTREKERECACECVCA